MEVHPEASHVTDSGSVISFITHAWKDSFMPGFKTDFFVFPSGNNDFHFSTLLFYFLNLKLKTMLQRDLKIQ